MYSEHLCPRRKAPATKTQLLIVTTTHITEPWLWRSTMSVVSHICLAILLVAFPPSELLFAQKKSTKHIQIARMVVELRVQLETQLNDSRPVWIQDIETDSHGDLYLLDSKFCRVLKYDPKGEFLLSIGKYGTGEKEFIRPDDIIIDSNDLLYVLDGPQKKICKYSHEGRFLERIQIDLKGAGMTLQGAAGPDGEIVLAGYKGGERISYS